MQEQSANDEMRMLLETMTSTLDSSIRTISKIEDHRHKEATQTKIILSAIAIIFLVLCYFS